MSRESVFAEIAQERERQQERLGWTAHNDDVHDELQWAAILATQLGQGSELALHISIREVNLIWPPQGSPEGLEDLRRDQADWRKELVHIAAVCVAALEAIERRKQREGR